MTQHSSSARIRLVRTVSKYALTLIICANNVAGPKAFINHTQPDVPIPIDHTKEKVYVHNVIGLTIITIKVVVILPRRQNL